MKNDNFDFEFGLWEYFEYAEDREQFLDVFTYAQITDDAELSLLRDLLLQTKKEMETTSIPQLPETFRQHEDPDGECYLIGKKIFQKVYKKSFLTHTLSPRNEVVLTPVDTNKIWFLNTKPLKN